MRIVYRHIRLVYICQLFAWLIGTYSFTPKYLNLFFCLHILQIFMDRCWTHFNFTISFYRALFTCFLAGLWTVSNFALNRESNKSYFRMLKRSLRKFCSHSLEYRNEIALMGFGIQFLEKVQLLAALGAIFCLKRSQEAPINSLFLSSLYISYSRSLQCIFHGSEKHWSGYVVVIFPRLVMVFFQ